MPDGTTLVVAFALSIPQAGALAQASPASAAGPTAAPSARALPPKPRARDLGVPFEGTPGAQNAITDVPGVEVGFTTLISGDGNGPFVVGQGPVRTGVTAVLPRGRHSKDPVFAGFFSQNGNGEMTGSEWLQEGGFLEGPVMITNTHSVGVVRDAVIAWEIKHAAEQEPKGVAEYPWSLPVVAETFDGGLNDVNGFHVHPEDAFHALDAAASGPVAEGNVGGGTGMRCFGFKGGTGTASRVLGAAQGGYVVGVLVQCNTGQRSQLRIAGVPVGQLVTAARTPVGDGFPTDPDRDVGSIIIVVATNAPLTSRQLDRLCKRATLGLGRVGGTSGDGSGDIFISFSTANPLADDIGIETPGAPRGPTSTVAHIDMLFNDAMDPLFLATIEATEEAIVNALVGAETMVGRNGRTLQALPHAELQVLMRQKFSPTAW
jgi:L-aminopeptidase/D-esterase-like protein